jgi:uncharacterized oligopeptide transporter (OPT) family protein
MCLISQRYQHYVKSTNYKGSHWSYIITCSVLYHFIGLNTQDAVVAYLKALTGCLILYVVCVWIYR